MTPKHIGFIMDGNGRWAKKRLMPRSYGHKMGVESLEKVLYACKDFGVKVVTVYAFSTENWNRPKKEITGLFNMITEFNKRRIDDFMKNNIRVIYMGETNNLPESVISAINNIAEKTKDNNGIILNVAFNYSGRQDIIQAVNKLLKQGKTEVNEKDFEKELFTAGLPDLDVLVRSSGEMRLSNFMLYQVAYTELIFIDDLWPDFDKSTIKKILEIYNSRDRRFGAIREE